MNRCMYKPSAQEIEAKAKAMRIESRLKRTPDDVHPGDAYAWAHDGDAYWSLWADRAREALIAEHAEK